MSDHQTPEQTPEPRRRRVMPAGRALVVIVVTLLVWAVLYAPELKRSAEAGDVGTRRTVSLALLEPTGLADRPHGAHGRGERGVARRRA